MILQFFFTIWQIDIKITFIKIFKCALLIKSYKTDKLQETYTSLNISQNDLIAKVQLLVLPVLIQILDAEINFQSWKITGSVHHSLLCQTCSEVREPEARILKTSNINISKLRVGYRIFTITIQVSGPSIITDL